MSKKEILIAVLGLILLGGAFLGYRHFKDNQVGSHLFMGTIVQKTDTFLVVKGYFSVDNHPEMQGPEQQVQVAITPKTQITKISYILPTAAETQGENGFILEQRPHESAPGLLSELGQGMGIESIIVIRSDADSYNKASFTASGIEYKRLVFPPTPTPSPSKPQR